MTGSCTDGVQNGDESSTDSGGRCGETTCSDGIQNGDETGVDTGGSCGGFDWGSSCSEGSGYFEQEMVKENEVTMVGIIPKGKVGVRVWLESDEDIDITLYDADNNAVFSEGKALVAYCPESGCNLGDLNGAKEQWLDYERDGMKLRVGWSGYNGVDNKLGHEWIEIEGETPFALRMGAYSYKVGTAKVNYKWDIYPSDCCMGVARCTGEFETPVKKDAIEVVGDIPPGKIDIQIRLASKNDVDIQVYDLEDTSKFDEGEAVVAWAFCGDKKWVPEQDKCNAGFLRGAKLEEYTYRDLKYTYSGYNGNFNKFGVQQTGDESISIDGTSNTNLRMTVYGYAKSDNAVVTYSYMNPPYEVPERPTEDSARRSGRSSRARSSSRRGDRSNGGPARSSGGRARSRSP